MHVFDLCICKPHYNQYVCALELSSHPISDGAVGWFAGMTSA